MKFIKVVLGEVVKVILMCVLALFVLDWYEMHTYEEPKAMFDTFKRDNTLNSI